VTNGSDPAGLDPRPLLAAYQAVLLEIPKLPRVLWVRRGSRGPGQRLRAARLRYFVRFFVLYHISRNLTQLKRLYNAGAALHPDAPSYEAGARQIDAFEQSLPPYRPRLALVALLLSVCFVSFLLARHVAPDIDPTLIAYLSEESDEDTGVAKLASVRGSADPLGKMTSASLTLSPRDFAEALKSFACVPEQRKGVTVTVCTVRRGVTNAVASLIFLGIAVWLVTFFPITSFRLKRMLFNLQPEAARRLSQELALNHAVTAQGVYRLEAEQFRRLGARPPREAPLDLLSQAGILVLPIWVGVAVLMWTGYGVVYVVRNGRGDYELTAIALLISLALLVFALPATRLASLSRIYAFRLADARSELPEPPVEELASWRRRAAAHMLDSIVVTVLWVSLAVPLSGLDIGTEGRLLAIAGALILAWLVYTAFLLVRGAEQRGRSLGKQALGLRVVRPSGERPSAARLVFREVALKGYLFGPAAVTLLGLPALLDYLFPLGHHRNRALHDLMADTIVVRELPAEAPVAVPSALAH
jgi:uncharacterized RDD family membrane protein YckC